MYTIKDYNEQVETCKTELDTLRDIVSDFIERWQAISDSIDNALEEMDDVPNEE